MENKKSPKGSSEPLNLLRNRSAIKTRWGLRCAFDNVPSRVPGSSKVYNAEEHLKMADSIFGGKADMVTPGKVRAARETLKKNIVSEKNYMRKQNLVEQEKWLDQYFSN